jgi:hypothetical protein
MSLPAIAAASVAAAGLFAAGYLTGRIHAFFAARSKPADAERPLARFEVTLVGQTIRTDAVVDQDLLDTLAHGVGRYTLPLPQTMGNH